MIVSKEEFMCRYMERFNHKIIQELKEKLPEKGFISELTVQATQIIHELTKEV